MKVTNSEKLKKKRVLGHDPDFITKNNSGFGLPLIHALVENELQGKLNTIHKNGTKYEIVF